MQALKFQYSMCLQQTWNKWREVSELTDGKELELFLLCSDCWYPDG